MVVGAMGLVGLVLAATATAAAESKLTEVKTPVEIRSGAYLSSLYDLNANNGTFTADLWLWFLHDKAREANPLKSLEMVNARDYKASLAKTEEHGEQTYHTEKVHGIFNHAWDVKNFPFDHHELQIVMEDGFADINELKYKSDAANTTFDPGINIEGWHVDRVSVNPGSHTYNSSFGLDNSANAVTYPSSVISIFIRRDASGLFWKLLAPVYVAFLIGFVSFFMDTSKDGIFTARVSLLVGMTFAVVINSQRVAATLGQASSFTLADKIHLLTLVYILATLICALASRHFSTTDRLAQAKSFDRRMSGVSLGSYAVLNVFMVAAAANAS